MEVLPLVSIVIPVYNGSNYMREAIDSALAQTYENIEVIVVNDGSNDGGATESIALSYGDKIRYFSKENGGVSTSLNLGIEKMRGDYFSWLSHDDLYLPDKVSLQIETVKACGDMTRLVYAGTITFENNEKSNVSKYTSRNALYPDILTTTSIMPVLRGINACTLLIHKSHFERVGVFDVSLQTAQDFDFMFRLFHRQISICVDMPLMKTRLHPEQGSNTISAYHKNCIDLELSFADRLSDAELAELPGGAYWYYYIIHRNLKSLGDKDAMRYVYDKFLNSDVPPETHAQLRRLDDYIASFSNNKATKLAIFCAGQAGASFYYNLKSHLIRVDTFADNDPKKRGYLFDGVYCISRDKLREQKDDTLVIVAAKYPDEVVAQLKEEGFPYVVTREPFYRILNETLPLKWVSDFELVKDVDYSSKDSQLLMTHYNKLIYDICKYYEDRLSAMEGI